MKLIQNNKDSGSRLNELRQVLPALSYSEVQSLVRELKAEEKICKVGNTSAARWYPKS